MTTKIKKFYLKPNSKFAELDHSTTILEGSEGSEIDEVEDGGAAKERPTDFSFGFDSTEE